MDFYPIMDGPGFVYKGSAPQGNRILVKGTIKKSRRRLISDQKGREMGDLITHFSNVTMTHLGKCLHG
jgi:hypothetical protein